MAINYFINIFWVKTYYFINKMGIYYFSVELIGIYVGEMVKK